MCMKQEINRTKFLNLWIFSRGFFVFYKKIKELAIYHRINKIEKLT